MTSANPPARLPGRARRRVLVAASACLAACVLAGGARAEPVPSGFGRQVATVDGTELAVFTYRPAQCQPRAVLLVFHGVGRNAATYSKHAVPLADRVCAIVAAPRFDRARFPEQLYQFGGVTRQAAGHRTVDLVQPLAAWARQAAGGPDLPIILLGHSAGAQFLSRVAAFAQAGAVGIVVANPSTWVMPSVDIEAPYGLGGTEAATEAATRAYLEQPVTVLLGTADTGTRLLVATPEAMSQGPNRHARGLNAFHTAQSVAENHGWRLGWTLAEVPGVGHDAAAMFASPQAADAVRRVLPDAVAGATKP